MSLLGSTGREEMKRDDRLPLIGEKRYESFDDRWQALVRRDAEADSHFFFAVKTTGVYGRPSSCSRLPKSSNVEFFESAEDAEAAGYRSNRRPLADKTALAAHRADIVTRVCRLIEAAEEAPRLEDLAAALNMSPFHLHRLFKAETGLTPKAYVRSHLARKLRTELTRSVNVTTAIYESGFKSHSCFYSMSEEMLGMNPKHFRRGGMEAIIHFAVGECSLGSILVAQSQRGICSILLGDDPEKLVHELQDQFPNATFVGADAKFESVVATVVGFVESPSIGLALPLDIRGTAFQERVWQALRDIPAGTTASYSEIAIKIGAPRSTRAVANACAANRIAVAIPCHRVVRNDGQISGYRWGVERKQKLLDAEQPDSL
jgi:AraC family transcriptional regulator, regulatory protein of adaptative response / methylated-DNA-[protein]-cysteine methyltransferase